MKTIKLILFFSLLILSACNENIIEPILYGDIHGVVLSPDGKTPIAEAGVTTNPPTNALITDKNGEFSIQNIPTGNYIVSASKNGFSKGTVSILVANGETSQAMVFLNTSSNNVPGTPTNPTPANQAANQSVSITLSWAIKEPQYFVTDSTLFDVYLYESGSSIESKIASNIKDTSIKVGNLKFNTSYYWQVVGKGIDTNKSYSAIWNFKTQKLPDNNIVFTRFEEGNYQILSTNPSGTSSIYLTSVQNRNWWPKLNKRYNKIAFSTDIEVEPQVYTINRDGSGVFKVTTISVTGYNNNGTGFCWSADGSQLFYGHYDKLYRINMDGSNLTLISTAPQNRNFRECDASPLGNKIAVHTIGTNVYESEIYLMNTDGSSNKLLVSSGGGKLEGPSFSIDGKRILYCYDLSNFQNSLGRALNSHIFSMSLDMKDTVDLSINKLDGTNDLNPCYSSDGSKVIFTNVQNDGSSSPNIWIMDSDGKNRFQIIENGIMPDWK